mgnify:CR=1 FL=1
MGKRIRKLITLSILAFSACTFNHVSTSEIDYLDHDLDAIIASGTLRAVIDFNSADYFIYKGEPMGFQYEMLQSFADKLGVDLELTIVDKYRDALRLLNDGKADIIAMNLAVNKKTKEDLLLTEPIMETRQVLVQRKPLNWREMTADELDRQLIRNHLDMAHKTIYVEESTVGYFRLLSLSNEIGDTIDAVEVPYNQDFLIEAVALGDIDFTVADENMALVSTTYYPNIDVATPISFVHNVAWGIRKENSDVLLSELNQWIAGYRNTLDYALLYAKYFRNSRTGNIVNSDYYSLNTGKISRWDDMVKSASGEINWDWRLLSSLIYQESRFDPNVVSWAGAFGLMQVMPATGKNFGVDITSATPKENIATGIKYIKWLESYFIDLVPDEDERLKFVLGSYNAGPGHILDAMRLAEKNGMDPKVWDGNVAVWLLKKSDPEYYNDSSVRHGYSRGQESVNYVTEILERYKHYKNIAPDESVALLSLNQQ